MKKIILLIITCTALFSCAKDPGSFSGNIYWKYNDYVGNKPDAGSEVKLYSLDKKDLTFETTSDVSGNFKIEDIPVGNYLAIIQSNNTTDSPKDLLDNLDMQSANLNHLFNYDLRKHDSEIKKIYKLQDLYTDVLIDDDSKYGGLENKIKKYQEIDLEIKNKSLDLIEKLPNNFKNKINIYSSTDKSIKLIEVNIKEGKNTSENIDFGTTYI